MAVSLSVVVLTFDEESNIRACLDSAKDLASEIFVVDSFSRDRTVAVAEACKARVVQHAFESHTKQWNWALSNLPISFDMILALDADQRVSPKLARSIGEALADAGGAEFDGYYVARRQIFRGKRIRFGGYYPIYLLKLFRRGAAWCDETELMDHHFYVKGPTKLLTGDLIEDNHNEWCIATWIDKHNRYAIRQAQEERLRELASHLDPIRPALFGRRDSRALWLKRLYRRLPLFVRPGIYFLYRYLFLLGFLDGREGFLFHFLQAYWYRLLVDVNLEELRRNGTPGKESVASLVK